MIFSSFDNNDMVDVDDDVDDVVILSFNIEGNNGINSDKLENEEETENEGEIELEEVETDDEVEDEEEKVILKLTSKLTNPVTTKRR